MAEVYGPPNGIEKLKTNNPKYWQLCVSRSKYTEAEIDNALADADQANNKLRALMSSAYDLLIDEHGEMNRLNGYASDVHRQLHKMLICADYIQANMSENSHLNCFPVRKWQKETEKLSREIVKIQNFIAKNFTTATPVGDDARFDSDLADMGKR